MNQFEDLCKLASEESWCWNVNCTTCGHQHFKYAFLELTQGKSPADDDWITSVRNDDITRSSGRVPRRFTLRQKEILAIICRGANLRSISQNCKSPDWLGYIGLVLYHTRKIPKSRLHRDSFIQYLEIDEPGEIGAFKRLSQDWARQLRELVWRDSDAYTRLCEIADEKGRIMTLKDLGACEEALYGRESISF